MKRNCEHEVLKRRYDDAFYCQGCKVTIASKELGAALLANADWAISEKVKHYSGDRSGHRWQETKVEYQSILGPELASKMGQAFARTDRRSRGEAI
jgi:hypothetical protein